MAQPEMKSAEFVTGKDVVCTLPCPLKKGFVITVYGFVQSQAKKFSVNLSSSQNLMGGDIALHADVRFDEGNVVERNSYEKGQWGAAERGGPTVPLQKNAPFHCTITVLQDKFELAYNGQYFCEFRNRIPQDRVSCVIVSGDVQVFDIKYGNK